MRRGIELPIPPPDAADPGAGPDERLAARRLGEQLAVALAALPEEQRAVVALREWEGLEYDEIAAIEGVPVGTVRSRLARARAALRETLAPAGGEVTDPRRSSRVAPVQG